MVSNFPPIVGQIQDELRAHIGRFRCYAASSQITVENLMLSNFSVLNESNLFFPSIGPEFMIIGPVFFAALITRRRVLLPVRANQLS
jgi:hypothetical protein